MRLSSRKLQLPLTASNVLRDRAQGAIGRGRGESRRLPVSLSLLLSALLCLFLLAALPLSLVMAQQTLALEAPTGLEASISAEGVALTWTAPAGQVDGYEILRQLPLQDETEATTLVDDTGSSDTSYTDSSATTPGERYVYQVKAIRGEERSEASGSAAIDYVTISCEIITGDNHDILHCEADSGDQTITSATWTPSFEVRYVQNTDDSDVNWVIADEYCGMSTTVQVEAHAGESALPTVETEITLECAPEAVDALSVSCKNLVKNDQHILSCALSGGDHTVDFSQWNPLFDAEAAQTIEGEGANAATWVIDQSVCGQTTTMEVSALSGNTVLPTIETTFPLACVIRVDANCSLANAIRSANGSAQVEESGDSDGNDDCETGADSDDTADPPATGDDIILLKRNVTLTADSPSLTSRVQFEGNGKTISGDANYRVFMVVGGHLSVNNLTITKGLASTVGGGIYVNSGSLSVSDSIIKDSKANDIGGGIYAIDSDVDIVDSEISGNMTVKGHGGAIYFISSTGLHTLDIVGATFKKNIATEDGGALKTAGGITTIRKSSFVENQADEGGAIESSEATLDIANSTFSGNRAREGGGLSSFSSFVTLTHTTWAYNSAQEQGGGIAIIGWTGNFKIRNTLITNSESGGDCHSGPNPNIIIDFTGNFIQDGSCAPAPAESQAAPSDDDAVVEAQAQQIVVAEAQTSDLPKAMISRLTGDPPHHPLQWGSPAIEGADPLYCSLDDQPDTARPQFGNCDIGAFEYPRAPDPPPEPPEDDDDDEPDDEPTPEPTPRPPVEPTPVPTPVPTPEPNICPVNDRIFVRTPNDDVKCAEIDTITLDKHPALQGARRAMRLWRKSDECMHIVAENDNLYRLAIQYDTTVEVLARHNDLGSDQLSVGQLLLLPACESDDFYFAAGTEVCFADQGGLVYIDTATPDRDVHMVEAYDSEGNTCGQIGKAGVVVLVGSEPS
ncbi:MAG: LysM peptidoglycan-binding domain-containing protein [Chloroflexi bacterium]|nr:LysM peptidoglycan-binding domain-containing protein [Chloroflexota bacterium]